MNNFFRTIIAGYGAKKLGGGCLSTVIIFFLIYYALGQCNQAPTRATAPSRSTGQVIQLQPNRTFASNTNLNNQSVFLFNLVNGLHTEK